MTCVDFTNDNGTAAFIFLKILLFENFPTVNPPPHADDCGLIHDYARSHNGLWAVSLEKLKADPWTIIMVAQDCALLVNSEDRPNWDIWIGNGDVGGIV
ncbi:hypothetical protein F5X99DRAFT_413251 [Biscogniauxia marginata]|nr:hypothetical protein F5X99DRAFT_413251 [Biscogniauxia marginata]